MEELVHTLKHPVTVGEGEAQRTFSSLTFSRAKAADLRAMDAEKGEMGKMLALMRSLTKLPKQVLEQLDGEDVLDIIEQLEAMLGKRQPTTESS